MDALGSQRKLPVLHSVVPNGEEPFILYTILRKFHGKYLKKISGDTTAQDTLRRIKSMC